MREYLKSSNYRYKRLPGIFFRELFTNIEFQNELSTLLSRPRFIDSQKLGLTAGFKDELQKKACLLEERKIKVKSQEIRSISIDGECDLQDIPSHKIAEFTYKYTP